MSERVGHISASSIAAFKACPQRYRIGYVEALRPERDAQPLRMGTAWHKGLEILEMKEGDGLESLDQNAPLIDITAENRVQLAVETACQIYDTIPDWADPTDWAVEREIVANGLAAYWWLYGSALSEYETVAVELEFDLPLLNPETGHPTPSFRRVGKIDRIVRHKGSGRLLIQENKSTGRSIDSGSTYWDRLRKDTQSKFYICAARDLRDHDAALMQEFQMHGLLHDVFHKPQISPKKLTQAESAEFVKTGEYCGQKFRVLGVDSFGSCSVDEVHAQVEFGAEPKVKKDGTSAPRAFAVRETPGMFGARLLQDMTQRPEFYFARREIAFTDAELEDFRYQVWALQKTMNEMERTGHWYENETSCEATFKCSYCSLCYNNIDVFHGQTPPGFKRLRVEEAEQSETGEAE